MSEMNISGKVVQVLPIQTGTSKAGNPWQKQEFVLDQGGQYPRKVCISLFGDNVAKIPQVGQVVMVSVDIDSREFNGRWYTEIKAWKGKNGKITHEELLMVCKRHRLTLPKHKQRATNQEDRDALLLAIHHLATPIKGFNG